MSLPKVAYFSMEMAIDDSLHIYSGGLGFLAGSHMLTTGHLNLPMVGVTILWANGYGDQEINSEGKVEIVYRKREYPFLKDTGIVVKLNIFGESISVKALKLEPDTFGTVPIYLLTTDIPENKEEHRHLTDILYDSEQKVRIAQEMILGQGGYRVLEAAKENVDLIHINEGHALPVLFEMLDRYEGNLEEVRKRSVFTTHTPVTAGNESHAASLLAEAGFFGKTPLDRAISLGGENFSLTVAALRMSRLANGVSQLHGLVANNMWQWVDGRCPIIAITNSVNVHYWQNPQIANVQSGNDLLKIKKQMKQDLFEFIHQKTGKMFDPDVLTIVWARRFTQYKRGNLIFSDLARLEKLLNGKKIQLIFAGKFHPSDTVGQETFNYILEYSRTQSGIVILPNYELSLSKILKKGADVWLNTPLRPLEASGTSGMSANMNGAIHLTTNDGWSVEGTYHGINGFIINEDNHQANLSLEEYNRLDYESMMQILEEKIIPMYYTDKPQWAKIAMNAIRISEAYFHSERMIIEYYTRLYRPAHL